MAQQASQKDVGRSYRAIEKFLQEEASGKGNATAQTVGVLHVTDLLRRYCSTLGLSHSDMRHATTIAEAACPRDAGYARRICRGRSVLRTYRMAPLRLAMPHQTYAFKARICS